MKPIEIAKSVAIIVLIVMLFISQHTVRESQNNFDSLMRTNNQNQQTVDQCNVALGQATEGLHRANDQIQQDIETMNQASKMLASIR